MALTWFIVIGITVVCGFAGVLIVLYWPDREYETTMEELRIAKEKSEKSLKWFTEFNRRLSGEQADT